MYEMLRSKSRHPKGGKKKKHHHNKRQYFHPITGTALLTAWKVLPAPVLHGAFCLHVHLSIFQPVGGFRSPAGLLLLLPSPTGEEEGTLNPSLYLRQKGRGWAKCRLRASKWEEPTVTVDLSEQPPEQPPVTKDGSTSLTGLCLSLCLWFSSQFFFFYFNKQQGIKILLKSQHPFRTKTNKDMDKSNQF